MVILLPSPNQPTNSIQSKAYASSYHRLMENSFLELSTHHQEYPYELTTNMLLSFYHPLIHQPPSSSNSNNNKNSYKQVLAKKRLNISYKQESTTKESEYFLYSICYMLYGTKQMRVGIEIDDDRS